ncbi:hypothetical protein OHC33_004611 [Knufia fluminis]|uniref:Xylanolytic transcriptional activator regulatory domain-containing protein n=1 Tax=Knufia fluminis TaxID=191047 RepID=A0AAN8EHA2_9EURO|nr:hypothetical protein OHC33_004611 [Knufia fluminis]
MVFNPPQLPGLQESSSKSTGSSDLPSDTPSSARPSATPRTPVEEDIESPMLANHVAIARPNAVVRDPPADIVRTSKYNAITLTHASIDPYRQFGSLQDKVADYEKILRGLSGRVSESDADLIRTTLERAAQMDPDEATTDGATLPSVEPDGVSEASGAESEVSGGEGSTGALDRTEEDFTREGAKTTGYMGKNSDITWLQRLRQENKYGEGTSAQDANQERLYELAGRSFRSHMSQNTTDVALPEADSGFTIQDSSYHLNDLNIFAYEAVAPYEMPTNDHARMLFNTYMQRVHPAFPIVGRMNLHNQFFKFMSKNGAQQAPRKWLAIINLIFAIAAKYSHFIQADWAGDERDHVIYFTRARMLAVTDETIFNHPDLQMIQILGLMSYYLLVIDQINRAWCLTGMAIRASNALALNMRNDSDDLSNGLKEVRYRVWWSLYALEHQLCGMTGRVNCILDDHCTCPLPVPVLEEDFETPLGQKLLSKEHQTTDRMPSSNANTTAGSNSSSRSGSNTKAELSRSPSTTQSTQSPADSTLEWAKDVRPNMALYFLHLVQISRLTQVIFQRLYNPTAVQARWSEIQSQIGDLNEQLDNWYRKLPAAFDFRRSQRDKDFIEARLSLGFFYYSTKMILHRPCLCRLDRKIPGQSAKSREFNRTAAITCVTSAQDQLALIPDTPNAVGFLKVGPWTTILHNLVQAVAVLMLEISFRAHHMPEQADDMIDSAKKAIRWLHALGEDNLAAARAWQLSNMMLRNAVGKIGRTVDDLPSKPPRTAGPGSDDISMATGSSSTQDGYGHGHTHSHRHGVNPGYMPPTSMTTSGMGMGDMSGMPMSSLSGYNDPLSAYDQFMSMGGNVDPSQMQFSQSSTPVQFQQGPTDAEMSFMDQFTDSRSEHPRQRGNQGGRSGFD